MSEMSTQLDRPYLHAGTRDAAVRFLTRTGNADLIDMLGLGDDPEPGERPDCPMCGRPRQRDKQTGWRACQRKQCIGAES